MKENKLQFQQEQAQKLVELGSRLRQFRTQQSLALDDVAAQTRIQERLLRAIEEGRLDQLPEPVYIKGFIKQFANALGLNGAEFASEFPTGSSLSFIKVSWRHVPTTQLRPFHLYLVYVLLVIGSVNGLSFLVRRSAISEVANRYDYQRQSQQLQPPHNSQVMNFQPKSESTKLIKASKGNQNSKPVQVGVIVKSESWIRVIADGKLAYEGVLPEGTQRTWVADQQLSVRAGNAGGVMVEFNNKSAKQMGEPGVPRELTFAANPKSRS
jgi:cytoskeletal protein RodZ